jgi:hypothetical protein
MPQEILKLPQQEIKEHLMVKRMVWKCQAQGNKLQQI